VLWHRLGIEDADQIPDRGVEGIRALRGAVQEQSA
jgi:hypothetical protein